MVCGSVEEDECCGMGSTVGGYSVDRPLLAAVVALKRIMMVLGTGDSLLTGSIIVLAAFESILGLLAWYL